MSVGEMLHALPAKKELQLNVKSYSRQSSHYFCFQKHILLVRQMLSSVLFIRFRRKYLVDESEDVYLPVLKQADVCHLKIWLCWLIILHCVCEKCVHFHASLKGYRRLDQQIPLFSSPQTDKMSETHLFHWVDRISQFTTLDRNTLFPLVHHVVDFFKLLLTTLLCVQ